MRDYTLRYTVLDGISQEERETVIHASCLVSAKKTADEFLEAATRLGFQISQKLFVRHPRMFYCGTELYFGPIVGLIGCSQHV